MGRRLVILIAAALCAGLASAPVSQAVFVSSGATTADLSTGHLLPPTALGASATGGTVTLSWTPTVSTGAAGYDVLRSATSDSGYAVVSSVSPASLATTTDAPGGGVWFYVLQTTLHSWTSAPSNEASVVLGSSSSSGLIDCVSNAPETVASGHNDGYETNAANGCGLDGAVAVDAGSGTDDALTCADAGKDRHRFWGYALGLPSSVTSIDGIEVDLTAGLSNGGRTSMLCVELSWDGGTSWTVPHYVAMPRSAITTYVFGGPAVTWGHVWTLGELDPATFVMRVTDVTNHPKKDFLLDAAQVEVTYTP
jgi:hypothetical protein